MTNRIPLDQQARAAICRRHRAGERPAAIALSYPGIAADQISKMIARERAKGTYPETDDPVAAPATGGQPKASPSWAFTDHRTVAEVLADEAAAREAAALEAKATARAKFEAIPANRFLVALRKTGQRFENHPEAVRPEPRFTAHRPTNRTTGGVSSYAF